MCGLQSVFTFSISLSHPCEIDGLIAISTMRELRLKKDEVHQLWAQAAEGSLISSLFQHSHQSEAAVPRVCQRPPRKPPDESGRETGS